MPGQATHPSAPPRARQRLRLWLALLRSSRFIKSALRTRLRDRFGQTLSQFDVLAALDRAGAALTMSELSHHLMVSNGNVTALVDRLAAEGLVLREQRAGDRRSNIVRMTRKGAQQFAAMAAEHETWVEDLLQDIAPAEAEQIVALLRTVIDRKKDVSR